MNEMMKLIHGADIYDNFDDSQIDLDLQGWNGDHRVITDIISKTGAKLVIEVGSWKGQSANTIANELRKMNGTLVCVDTWLGSAEHWLNDDHRQYDLVPFNGYPTLYFKFLSNMKKMGHSNTVVPFPLASAAAAEFMKKKGVLADVIYIDASHEYESVKSDIAAWWDVLRPGGIMFGDDYAEGQVGVIRAVNEFFKERSLEFYNLGFKWVAKKPS